MVYYDDTIFFSQKQNIIKSYIIKIIIKGVNRQLWHMASVFFFRCPRYVYCNNPIF